MEERERMLREIIKHRVLRDMRIRDFEQDGEVLKKRFGDFAKEMGVSRDDLLKLMKELFIEVLDETKEKVRKTTFK